MDRCYWQRIRRVTENIWNRRSIQRRRRRRRRTSKLQPPTNWWTRSKPWKRGVQTSSEEIGVRFCPGIIQPIWSRAREWTATIKRITRRDLNKFKKNFFCLSQFSYSKLLVIEWIWHTTTIVIYNKVKMNIIKRSRIRIYKKLKG